MPRVTRSSELLQLLDGLFHIDDDVIDIASKFYNELKSTVVTFGEDSVERLLPHIISLMTRLNDVCKENTDLKMKVNRLCVDLSSVEMKNGDLNTSLKDKANVLFEMEDNFQTEIDNIRDELAQTKEENRKLTIALNESNSFDVNRLRAQSEEKVASLTAERRRLLTTIEVLDADVKCLRAELRRMEQRSRQRLSSFNGLLAETSLPSSAVSSPAAAAPSTSSVASQPSEPRPGADSDISLEGDHHGDVLLIGDSLLRYASKKCMLKGVKVECCPGGKIIDIKNRLLQYYVGVSLSVIYFHVGTNNLMRGYRGGPGYNGGHGKREALHDMADLLYTAKTQFPHSKIFLNSVLIRRDLTYKALYDFNCQLELMSYNFNVQFVEANCCVGRRHLSRDGIHLNRAGVSRLGSLLADVIDSTLRYPEAVPHSKSDQDEVTAHLDLDSGCEDVILSGPQGNCDASNTSEN